MSAVLSIPILTWEDAWANDPDAMDEAIRDFWDAAVTPRYGGRTGSTSSDGNSQTTPDTHYQWSIGYKVQDASELADGLEELACLVEAVIAANPVPPVEGVDRVDARKRARRLARRSERRTDRQAERKERRKTRRIEARQAYRGDRHTTNWADAEDEIKDQYLLRAANALGHADVLVTI